MKKGDNNKLQRSLIWLKSMPKIIIYFVWFLCVKITTPILWIFKRFRIWIAKQWQNIRLSATYHQASKTSLYRFNEALKGNKKALKKCFFGNQTMAFYMLYDEFCKLSGSKEYQNIIKSYKDQMFLYAKIVQLRLMLMLNDPNIKDIKKLTGVNSVKAAKGILKLWVDDYENLLSAKTTDNKESKGLDAQIIVVSEKMKYYLNQKTIKVSEFALMLKLYNEEIELSKKKIDNYGK